MSFMDDFMNSPYAWAAAPGAKAMGFGNGGNGLFGYGSKNPMPDAPDLNAAAQKTAQGNRPNINTPFGSQNWAQDANGNWTMNTQLAPGMQGLANGLMGQANESMGQALPSTDAARKQAEDAIYGRATSRLDPQWSQRENAQKTSLLNQGLDPSSEMYNNQMDSFNRNRNDAYQTAMDQSIIGGGQEASRSLQDALARRNAPLQEMGGLQGMLQMPGFKSGPDYMDAMKSMYGDQLERYSAQAKQDENNFGGLLSMGKMAAGFA